MIGFRVDANEKIATGHLMRCIAIASECMKRGESCVFLLAEEKETERLMVRNMPYRILNSRWNDLESELPMLQELLLQMELDWLVVDSYQATPQYLEQLNRVVPVLYVDDMGEQIFPVSAVLHYGIGSDDKDYREPYAAMDTCVLAGIQYTPLREEFMQRQLPAVREKNILITTGGTDPYNVTGRLLSLCTNREILRKYHFYVIVGSMNDHEEQLKALEMQYEQIHLFKNIGRMSDYMCRCQMAVSAGGTTLLELCACQTPTVCFSFADNQLGGTRAMGEQQVMIYAGDARQCDVAERIADHLQELAQQPERRREYAARMERLVDGRGVQRIADILCEKEK